MAIYQWGAGPYVSLDGNGVLHVPEGGAVAVHPSPAASGAVRLPNEGAIMARDSAGGDDVELGRVDSSNHAVLGGANSREARIAGDKAARLLVAGSPTLSALPSSVEVEAPSLAWTAAVTDPVLAQNDLGGEGATGNSLTVRAQTCSGRDSVGGALHLRAGRGVLTHGTLQLQDPDGNSRVSVSPTGDVTVNANASLVVQGDGADVMRVEPSGVTLADAAPFANFANSTWKSLTANETRTLTATSTLLGGLSFELEPGDYTFRIHIIVQTPSSNNGGVRVGGNIASGVTPTNVARLGSIIRVLTTSSSIVTYQLSSNMTGDFGNALTTRSTYVFVAEGAFTLTAASVYEVTGSQLTSASGATTFRLGSYAMFNKCSN